MNVDLDYSIEDLEKELQRRQERQHLQRILEDAEASKERCQSFPQFIREAWHVLEPGTPYTHGWHIDAMCEHAAAVSLGQITRLQVNVPPGCMKSMIFSVLWQAWEWGPFGRPHLRYLTASYEQDYAKRDARKTRDLVLSDWYQARWPVKLDRVAEMSFENDRRGNREAKSYGSLTAGRGNRVVIDDPHSVKTAESDADRNEVTRLFRESVSSRLNDIVRDAIVVVMHRLHGADVCGVIEQLGLDYVRLVLPMEFEVKRRCVTSIGWKDPRKIEGDLLFPERFPREDMEKQKKTSGSYAWAGQYQQRPSPREGGMFKRHWFAEKIIKAEAVPKHTTWVRRWDLAGTKSDKGARSAGIKIGRMPDGRFVVAHSSTCREEYHEVRRQIRSVADTDGINVTVVVPQDPGSAGKAVAQDLIKALAGFKAFSEPETGDKVSRAEPFSAQCEAGNVYLVEGSWVEAYLDELCDFPGVPLKDQVDASSGAFNWLANKTSNYLDALMRAV